MKKLFTVLVVAAMATGTMGAMSCDDNITPTPSKPDDKENPTPTPPEGGLPAPSATGLAELRQKALAGMTVKKTFKANQKFEHTTEKGVRVTLAKGLMKDNKAATGNADFSIVAIHDRGSMAVANRPLMGKNTRQKYEPLVAAGQIFLEVKQGDVHLAPYMKGYGFEIPVSLTGGSHDAAMVFWRAIDGDPLWSIMGALVDLGEKKDNKGKTVAYDANIETETKFYWTCLGKIFTPSGSKTNIKVHVPDGYNGENAALYLAYENEPSLLGQLAVFNDAGKFFTADEGFVPVGKKVHLIFVSEADGKFAHAIKTLEISADATVTFESGELAAITEDALVKKINALK